MKNSMSGLFGKLVSVSLVVGVILPRPAFAGPGTSGGGNPTGSSAAAIQGVIRSAVGRCAHSFFHDEADHLETKYGPRIQRMINTIPSRLWGGVESENFNPDQFEEWVAGLIRPSTTCRDQEGTVVGASTTLSRPGAPICLNVSAFESVPRESLLPEVSALVCHELAHQAGYGESDAEAFQRYIKQREQESLRSSLYTNQLINAANAIESLQGLLERGASRDAVCTQVGYVEAQIQAIGTALYDSDVLPTLSDSEATRHALVVSLVRSASYRDLRTFCVSESDFAPVSQTWVGERGRGVCPGDVQDLSRTLDVQLRAIEHALDVTDGLLTSDSIPEARYFLETMGRRTAPQSCRGTSESDSGRAGESANVREPAPISGSARGAY